MDQSRNRNTLLIAAAILVAPRLKDLKDSPALRTAVNEAIRVAEFIARVLDTRYNDTKPAA